MGVNGLLMNTHIDSKHSENNKKTHFPLQKLKLFINKLIENCI